MNTPETDRVWAQHQGTTAEFFDAVVIHARRLETDRAALMEALEEIAAREWIENALSPQDAAGIAERALAAAHANFPTP